VLKICSLLLAALAVAAAAVPAAAVRAPVSDAARATAVPPPAPVPPVPAAARPPAPADDARPARSADPADPGVPDDGGSAAGADIDTPDAVPEPTDPPPPAMTPALPGAAEEPAAPDAATQWVFARDGAARAAAWIAPADAAGRISLRCVTAPRSRSVQAAADSVAVAATPGFVDLVVDAGVFFPDVRPQALRSAPFRISELRIAIDGAIRRSFNARYARERRHYVTSIALDDPFLEGLMAGYTLWLDEPLADGRVRTTLTGSRDAITSLIDACP